MSATGPSNNRIHANLVAARQELEALANKPAAQKEQTLKNVNQAVKQAFTDLENQKTPIDEKGIKQVWTDIRDLMREVHNQEPKKGKNRVWKQLEGEICKLSGHIVFDMLDRLPASLIGKLMSKSGRKPADEQPRNEEAERPTFEARLTQINSMSPSERRAHQVATVRDMVMQARLNFSAVWAEGKVNRDELLEICNGFLDEADKKLSTKLNAPAKRAALQEVESFRTDLDNFLAGKISRWGSNPRRPDPTTIPREWRAQAQALQERLGALDATLKGKRSPSPRSSESDETP